MFLMSEYKLTEDINIIIQIFIFMVIGITMIYYYSKTILCLKSRGIGIGKLYMLIILPVIVIFTQLPVKNIKNLIRLIYILFLKVNSYPIH